MLPTPANAPLAPSSGAPWKCLNRGRWASVLDSCSLFDENDNCPTGNHKFSHYKGWDPDTKLNCSRFRYQKISRSLHAQNYGLSAILQTYGGRAGGGGGGRCKIWNGEM